METPCVRPIAHGVSLCLRGVVVIGVLLSNGYNASMIKTVLNPGWTQVWSVDEMTEIIHDARRIEADPSLRVNSDGSPVRGLGIWEAMRLESYADIVAGRIWMKE